MKELLLLVHRIPYPPNKGDKIRSFHLLRHLARHYRIHLGTFIDDPADRYYIEEVRKLCGETYFASLKPRLRKLKSLTVLLGDKQALTLAYYHNAALQVWVDQVLTRFAIQRVLVFSSAMAQYVSGPPYCQLHRVIDFVDVDSAKWLQYSRRRRWPLNWLYRRESKALLRFERRIAAEFAANVFVTAKEAALFRQLVPEAAARTFYAHNGVDTDFFIPDLDYPNPYPAAAQVLVFTGAMDYWANVDAVCWFTREVFPTIRQAVPAARFYIVGARPTMAVQQLNRFPGVQVVGAVRDIRPYLAHARLAVAPLRIARGVQNKVLEAMAMAKPVVVTRAAAEGILPCQALEPWMADEPRLLATAAVSLLQQSDPDCGLLGRAWVLQHCSWPKNLDRIEQLVEGMPPAATVSACGYAGEIL
jgi:sugar transferase (PEP-CTERM/EpsH1 system associated)